MSDDMKDNLKMIAAIFGIFFAIFAFICFIVLLFKLFIFIFVGNEPRERYRTDEEIMAAVFKDCLDSIPKGPEEVVYNDWDEVVEQCRDHAREVSWRCYKNCTDNKQ